MTNLNNNPSDPHYTGSAHGATPAYGTTRNTTDVVVDEQPNRPSGWLTALGGALLALGSFLPWLTGKAQDGDSDSANGWDVEDIEGVWNFPFRGWLFLLLGLALLAHGIGWALRALGRNTKILPLIATVASALSLLLSILALMDMNGFVDMFKDAGGDGLGTGWGMWLLPIGSLLSLLGSLWALMQRDRVDHTTTTAVR